MLSYPPAVLEEYVRERRAGQTEESEQRCRPLEAELVVHLHAEERKCSGEARPCEAVGCKGAGGVEGVRLHEEGEDAGVADDNAEADEDAEDDGDDPVDPAVCRPA